MLNLNFTHARRPLTVGEVKALNIFGSIAATALESSRLHEKLLAAERKYHGIFVDTSILYDAVRDIIQATQITQSAGQKE